MVKQKKLSNHDAHCGPIIITPMTILGRSEPSKTRADIGKF